MLAINANASKLNQTAGYNLRTSSVKLKLLAMVMSETKLNEADGEPIFKQVYDCNLYTQRQFINILTYLMLKISW